MFPNSARDCGGKRPLAATKWDLFRHQKDKNATINGGGLTEGMENAQFDFTTSIK